MRILRVEIAAGIDGNQLVGALADLGVNPSSFEWEFSKLDVGDFHMHFERPAESGAGVAFSIHPGATHRDPCDHEHNHDEHDELHHAHAHTGGGHAPDEPADDNGHTHTHHHPAGAEDRDGPAFPGHNLNALRRLVENSSLSDRSKAISLGLLTQLEPFTSSLPGPDLAGQESVLSESELGLLAQTVLIGVGIDQLKIDQIEPVHANKSSGGGRSGAAPQPLSLDPVIAAVQAVLPRGEAPAGSKTIKSGAGLAAAGGARVKVSLLEG